jgi:hypothetical protein
LGIEIEKEGESRIESGRGGIAARTSLESHFEQQVHPNSIPKAQRDLEKREKRTKSQNTSDTSNRIGRG